MDFADFGNKSRMHKIKDYKNDKSLIYHSVFVAFDMYAWRQRGSQEFYFSSHEFDEILRIVWLKNGQFKFVTCWSRFNHRKFCEKDNVCN